MDKEKDGMYMGRGKEKSYKYDEGKTRMSLVPPSLIRAVGVIRTYGTAKYNNDPDGWLKVEKVRYKDALMRHLMDYLEDEDSHDEESGFKHLWHIACNVAFLIEMQEMEAKGVVTEDELFG